MMDGWMDGCMDGKSGLARRRRRGLFHALLCVWMWTCLLPVGHMCRQGVYTVGRYVLGCVIWSLVAEALCNECEPELTLSSSLSLSLYLSPLVEVTYVARDVSTPLGDIFLKQKKKGKWKERGIRCAC